MPRSRAQPSFCLGARLRGATTIAALLLVSCATPPFAPHGNELAARVDAELKRRGAESDLLQVIDNLVRHEPGPPAAAPALVRQLFAQPLAAADADALFRRAVPSELLAFESVDPAAKSATLDELVAQYIAELGAAQALLREASADVPIDAAAIREVLESGLESAERLVALVRIDEALLRRANAQFIRATARFVDALRGAGGALAFPEQALRFDSAIGPVSIGTRGNDRHGPDAALVLDPAGDDDYERAPANGGVSVVIDLGGNDTYRGADLAVQGFAAIVDFSGDDLYDAAGPGLGAAVAGASLLVDFSGNDIYAAGFFGQGAAAFGLGVLLDYAGDDRYQVRGAGQGFGLAGGVGLLWDRAGNDRYVASGLTDAYGRGGEVSFAQGAAFGLRTRLAGGIGILRDDAGDDEYDAQMFAQGTGYYYGLGLAWDRAGNDRWRAVRYAQGNGVHEAVGVLRDEGGDDRYELSYGVGQGMGLDLALGLLYDAGGNDRYQATVHAQGNATANGVGVLFDSAGADEWHMGADARAWGRAEPARRLPSLGLLLYQPEKASFLRDGAREPPPQGSAPIEAPKPAAERRCPAMAETPASGAASFAEALRNLELVFRGSPGDPRMHAYVQQRLLGDLERALGELPRDDFTIDWVLGNALPCALRQAAPEQALAAWTAMGRVLEADPASPFALPIVAALRERPAPAAQLEKILRALQSHPSCAVRTAALTLEGSASAAQAALGSFCWMLQAAALELLDKLGAGIAPGTRLPSFLRRGLP